MIRIQTSIILLAFIAVAVTPGIAYGADWYSSDWTYAKAVVTNSTQIPSTQTDFPVVIQVTDADLTSHAQADCDDIVFVDSTNSTKYPHEIEECDLTASDKLTAWVSIPTLSGSADTTFFMYYGNATMASQENVTGTWNSNYEAVYHLHDDFLDSTSNSYDGTNSGSTNAPGDVIADGQSFDGINDYISTTNQNNPNNGNISMSAWINKTSTSTGLLLVLAQQDGTGTGRNNIHVNNNHICSFLGGAEYCGTTTLSLSTDYMLTNTIASGTGSVNSKLYIDGVLDKTQAINPESATGNIIIGIHKSLATNEWKGIIDEVHYYNTEMSADWILTEYNNQKPGSTFLAIGSEGTEPASSYTANITDDLGLDDSVSVVLSGVFITDDLGLDDSVSTDVLTTGGSLDLSTATYDSDITPGTNNLVSIRLSPDGLEMYILSRTTTVISHYTLTSPFDISSYSFTSSYTVSEGTDLAGIDLSHDGTKLYVASNGDDTIRQYTLSTAWLISSASYDGAGYDLDISTEENSIHAFTFRPNGLDMYIVGGQASKVHQYTLTTAWNLSTASYSGNSIVVSTDSPAPFEVQFADYGGQMYILDHFNNTVDQYALGTYWDVTTATYDGKTTSTLSSNSRSAYISNSFGKMAYVELGTADRVILYNIANSHERTVTDDLGLDDSVSVPSSTREVTDDLGLDDSVTTYLGQRDATDDLGLDDSADVDVVHAIYNAIRLFINPPTATRLGGIFAESCTPGEYVTGIGTDGHIICAP